MSVRRSLAFGLASAACSALVGLAVVPFYLRFLGIEAYGLIGIYSAAFALFSLLDFGLAPAMTREMARCTATNNVRPARVLLHSLSILYWSTAVAIALAATVGAPLLSRGWFTATQLPQESMRTALMLIGLVLACRWPQALYLGALLGAERMVTVSTITMAMTMTSGFGAVAVLAWVSPTIEAFFIWQAAVGLLHVLILRAVTWHVIGTEQGLRFSKAAVKSIWRFSTGIGGVALTALILTQVDKVILSRLLTLSSFGEYTLATVATSAVYLIVNPVFNIIYPRFTALVAAGAHSQLAQLYRAGTRTLAVALFPLCMTLAIFANDILFVWTGNQQLAESVAPVLTLLVAGAALHSVMYFPYALQLAYGSTRLPLTISGILLIVSAPLTAALAWRYGTKGGATANVLLYVLYLFLGAWMTHRKLLPSVGWSWLLRDVCLPFCISLSFGVIGKVVLVNATLTTGQKLGLACLLLSAAWIASVASSPREMILRTFQARKAPL